jgi:hypothetical protein
MNLNTDPKRNRPSEEGKDNDPNVKDDSAIQPHVNTISSSNSDNSNEQLTKTANDDFRTEKKNDKADTVFDEIGDEGQ